MVTSIPGITASSWKNLREADVWIRQLVVESRAMTDKLRDPAYDKVSENFPRKLSSFREQAVQFLIKS